jgi:two-component system, probable response regulator PhcQ
MRLLIVDDEPAVLSALRRALRHHFGPRLEVDTESDAHQALARLRHEPCDIVMSDLRMPALDGLSLLTLVPAMQPRCVRLLLTGSADFETAQRAINEAGLFRYLTKPWLDSELAAHLEAAMAEAARIAGDRVPLTAEEAERRRLEALEPGLTQVDWGPGGEVLMPPLADER